MTRITSRHKPVFPPDTVIRRIANETGVDERRYPQTWMSVRSAVEIATQELWHAREADPIPLSLVHVMLAARELNEKIDGLDEGARRILSVCLEDREDGERLVPGEDGRLRPITIQDYEGLLTDLGQTSGEAAEVLDKKPRRVGAPRGPRNYPLAVLVRRLRLAVETEGGGRLTYERRTQKGTLVTVLKLLRPHVVKGLIPVVLPWRSLEEMNSRKLEEITSLKTSK